MQEINLKKHYWLIIEGVQTNLSSVFIIIIILLLANFSYQF